MQFRLLSLFVLCLIPAAALAQRYSVTDLGQLSPTGINSWAQVVGSRNGQAVVWSQWGGTRYLGKYPGGTFSTATAINDLGQIVGMGDLPPAECSYFVITQTIAFFWSANGGMQRLGTMGHLGYDACLFSSYPTDINLRGQVVGVNGKPSTSYVDAFLWTKSAGMALLPGIYNAAATAINTNGQIVGTVGYFENMDPQHEPVPASSYAALWSPQGDLTELESLDPSTHYNCSSASDINDAGQVVGWSNVTTDCHLAFMPHALLWTRDGVLQDLGTLPGKTTSVAYKINYFGQVIGSSDGVPFIWTQRSGMLDLNTLISRSQGWTLNTATAINLWGQIVGEGIRYGQLHGYLLTPMNPFEEF